VADEHASDSSPPPLASIRYAAAAGEVTKVAADELRDGLAAMLGHGISELEPIVAEPDPTIGANEIRVALGGTSPGTAAGAGGAALAGDSFEISRAENPATLVIRAGSERGLIHAAADLLERLGARFAPGVPPQYPRIEPARLESLELYRVEPAFARRGFVSDIMTWNYTVAERFELHLRHDREFIPWMARRGINSFSYIRHAHDTRLRIDELVPSFRAHGIAAEYGGHVLQILMPREKFEAHPEYFPAGDDGVRSARGNLCVSNQAALDTVRDGALRYVHDFPENELLHIWGADVWRGAWCRCDKCIEMPPQLQYMEVVNAIAEALQKDGSHAPPVAYLAYHDTIEPHPGLRPLPNVWFEWAPRERCYSHAIDDPACETNPRYLETLKRYLELFDGRGHVFEYYADAILWGGLGFATPAIVARDLRAYRALGITSVSCLTFGAFSVLAYPVNLEAFVRGSRDPGFDPDAALADSAAGRHPACASEMAAPYAAVVRASRLALDYGDVMAARMTPTKAVRKRGELREAADIFREGIVAAERIRPTTRDALIAAEQGLWKYSAQVLGGLSEYLAAKEDGGPERIAKGTAAIAQVAAAIEHVRAIDLEIKGTWGAYDLEWLREIWLAALRRGLEEQKPQEETV
jgi:hypothetical protein